MKIEIETTETKCDADKLAKACNDWDATNEEIAEFLKKLSKNGKQASIAGVKLRKQFIKMKNPFKKKS